MGGCYCWILGSGKMIFFFGARMGKKGSVNPENFESKILYFSFINNYNVKYGYKVSF